MRVALQATLLLAAVALTCAVAPSTSAPGGLQPAQTPQFVIISHDDSIKEDTHNMLVSLTDGKTANGCPVTLTLFITRPNTANKCDFTMDLYDRGFEIADHTMGHTAHGALTKEEIAAEILPFRPAIAKCGVPESDVVGFRAPFLETKPEQRQVLYENGFLYDSTLVENTKGRSMSPDQGHRVFPWTMDNGTAIDCDKFQRRQVCEDYEKYPGLWQIPIWQMTALGGPYNLDPAEDKVGQTYDVLVANFDAAYNGNRAPYGIPFHSPWLALNDNLEAMKRFVDYASAKEGVYFITYRQLIPWMLNPVAWDQLTPAALGCGNKGGAPGTLSSSGGSSAAGLVGAPAPQAAPAGVPAPEAALAAAPTPQAAPVVVEAPSPEAAPLLAAAPSPEAAPEVETPSSPPSPPAVAAGGDILTAAFGGRAS